jgi:hypothetical protein
MTNSLSLLAARFASLIDAVESYPGEENYNQEKIEAANKTIVDDLQSISSNYHMYESQAEQAKKQMTHQLYLLRFAKKVQELIQDTMNGGEVNIGTLNEQLMDIRREAVAASKHIGMRVSLSELQALRILDAMVDDDIARSTPKVVLPDWAELASKKNDKNARLLDPKNPMMKKPK